MGPYGYAALGLMLAAAVLLHYAAYRVRRRRWWRAHQAGQHHLLAPFWPHWRVWNWWMSFHRWRLGIKEYHWRQNAWLFRHSVMWWALESETPPGIGPRLRWAARNAKLRVLAFWYHKGAADYVQAAYARQNAALEAEKQRREREAAARKEEARRQAEEERRRREEELKRREREARGDPGEPWGLKGDAAYRRACEIMGLGGAFAKAELHRRYRDLQAAVHPDKGGSGYFAKQLNWARDVIVRRHGW